MIILNQKERDPKYLRVDDVLIEINGNVTLEDLYDSLRKENKIPENIICKAFQKRNGDVLFENEEVPPGDPEVAGYETLFEDENSLDDANGKVKWTRPEVAASYERFLLGSGGPDDRFTEIPVTPALLKKELVASLGIQPALADDERPVAELKALSAKGDRLTWGFVPVSTTNPLPTKEDIELYDSLSGYEKRIINDTLFHPMAVLSLARELKKYGKDTKLTKEAEAFLKQAVTKNKTLPGNPGIGYSIAEVAASYQTPTLYAANATGVLGFSGKREAEMTAAMWLDNPTKSVFAMNEKAKSLLRMTDACPIRGNGDGTLLAFKTLCKSSFVIPSLKEEDFTPERLNAFWDKLYQEDFKAFLEKKKADKVTDDLMVEFIGRQKTPEGEFSEKVARLFKEALPRVPQIATEYVAMHAMAMGVHPAELSDDELKKIIKDFDFKNVQIVRPYNNPALYAFCDKLNFKDMRKEHLEVFATHLRPCMVRPMIEKGFAEWYEKYKGMNPSDLSAVLSLNKEVLSGYGSRIHENFYYAHEKISRFNLDKDPKSLLTDVRMMRADGDRKQFDRKYPLKFKDQELAIKGRHTVAKQGKLTMEMMQPGDLRIFNAGQDTCCCQELGNAGESCVYKIIADPFATEVAIVKNGTVIAQGFVWVDNEKDTLVFDNVEFANYKTVSFDNRIKDFTDLFAEWSKAMPYANVHIGTGCLAASMAGWGQQIKREEFAKLPTTMEGAHCYSDYHESARTIKRDGRMLITAKGAVQITTAPDEPTRWDLLRDNAPLAFLLNDFTQSPEERLSWGRQFLEHPDDSLQMMAVQRNPGAIKGLENPCVDVQVWIARNHPELVIYIQDPCPEIQDEIVRQNPKAIRNIQNPTEQMMIYAVEKDRSLVKYVRDKNPSEAVYLAAVRKDGLAIVDIPEDDRTEAICLAAIRQKSIAISHIKNPSETLWKAAFDKDPTLIKMFKSPTREQQLYAVEKKASAILSISHPHRDAVAEAVRKDGLLVRNFQNQFPELREVAIRQNPFVVTNGTLKAPSDEEYCIAVRRNPAVLNLIRNASLKESIREMVSGRDAGRDAQEDEYER